MEQRFERALSELKNRREAAVESLSLQEDIAALEEYYGSNEWKQDFADDEAGKLPQNLRRGVLSEDAVYDFLALRDEVLGTIRKSFPKKAD